MTVFNKLGMLADLFGNASKLRETFEKTLESLGQVEVEASAGGCGVTARVNGRLQVVAIRIDPALLTNPDAELLEDLIAAAVNAGLVKAREAAAQAMANLTGGLPMGIFPDLGAGPTGGDPGGRP